MEVLRVKPASDQVWLLREFEDSREALVTLAAV